MLELQVPVEPRSKACVVVVGPRHGPGLHALRGSLGHLRREIRRDAPCLGPILTGDPDQAGVVRIVGQGLLQRLQLVEQLADAVVREHLVSDALQRRQAVGTNGAARGGHHHELIPLEHGRSRPQVVDVAQSALQLGELGIHRSLPFPSSGNTNG